MTNRSPLLTLLLICLLAFPTLGQERIAWYGSLKDGLQASKQTGKPILLISAAVQCKGVSGIF